MGREPVVVLIQKSTNPTARGEKLTFIELNCRGIPQTGRNETFLMCPFAKNFTLLA